MAPGLDAHRAPGQSRCWGSDSGQWHVEDSSNCCNVRLDSGLTGRRLQRRQPFHMCRGAVDAGICRWLRRQTGGRSHGGDAERHRAVCHLRGWGRLADRPASLVQRSPRSPYARQLLPLLRHHVLRRAAGSGESGGPQVLLPAQRRALPIGRSHARRQVRRVLPGDPVPGRRGHRFLPIRQRWSGRGARIWR